MELELDIDDDVLEASREIAKLENKTVDVVVTELVRRGLEIERSEEAHD